MSQYRFSLRASSRSLSELCLSLSPSYVSVSLRATSRYLSELGLDFAPTSVSFTLRPPSSFLCKQLGLDLVRAASRVAGLGIGGRLGRSVCVRLVARNGGLLVWMERFGWFRRNWDPGGCLKLKSWSWTLFCWMRASLIASMEGSIGGSVGCCAVRLALGTRRCTVPCSPYLLREGLGGKPRICRVRESEPVLLCCPIGRCWKKRGFPFWVELTCLGAAIEWSFEDLIGS